MSDADPLEDYWRTSFESVDSKIDDQFFRRLVAMHRARAQLYQLISLGLLGATVVLVFIGVFVFVRGDPHDDILARSEVDLIDLKRKTQDQINKLDLEVASAGVSVTIVRRSKTLASVLLRTKSGLMALSRQPSGSLLTTNIEVVGAGLQIVERMSRSDDETSTTIILPQGLDDGSASFPGGAFKLLKDETTAASIDHSELTIEMRGILDLLKSVAAKAPGSEKERLSPDDERLIRDRVSAAAQLAKADGLFSRVMELAKKAEVDDQLLRESSSRREVQKQKLAKEKENLDEQLKNVREQREKILFMSWIPGLTLRVGTVVLLLFLTQVMLSTYRYTLGIAGFYLARSDGIQLLQSATESSTRYLPEQLIALMEAMTPNRYQIDPVKDPTDQLSDLAKSWISRFKP